MNRATSRLSSRIGDPCDGVIAEFVFVAPFNLAFNVETFPGRGNPAGSILLGLRRTRGAP